MARGGKISTDLQKALTILERCYPDPKSELDFKNTYQLAVAVLLSAQCTDKKVNQVTPELFNRYESFRALGKAKISDLEKILRPINYYKTKSKHLQSLGEIVTERFNGELPLIRSEVITLPGIGNKTANVILGELGVEATFPVDTHVFRVSQRLGWTKGKTPGAIEEQLKKTFPPESWRNLHHWLILHGRRICKAPRPLCEECQLEKLCPKKGVTKTKGVKGNEPRGAT